MEVQGKLAGGGLTALARRYFEHAESAKAGGDLGALPGSRLLPEVPAALSTMEPGDVAGAIETEQGIHFVRLVERKAAAIAPLADVRAVIVRAPREQRSHELKQRYVAGLASESPPSVNEFELGRLRARLK